MKEKRLTYIRNRKFISHQEPTLTLYNELVTTLQNTINLPQLPRLPLHTLQLSPRRLEKYQSHGITCSIGQHLNLADFHHVVFSFWHQTRSSSLVFTNDILLDIPRLINWGLSIIKDQDWQLLQWIVLRCFGVAVPWYLGLQFEWYSFLQER